MIGLILFLLGWIALGLLLGYLLFELEVIPEPSKPWHIWAIAWAWAPWFIPLLAIKRDKDFDPTVGEYIKFLFTMQDTEAKLTGDLGDDT